MATVTKEQLVELLNKDLALEYMPVCNTRSTRLC